MMHDMTPSRQPTLPLVLGMYVSIYREKEPSLPEDQSQTVHHRDAGSDRDRERHCTRRTQLAYKAELPRQGCPEEEGDRVRST